MQFALTIHWVILASANRDLMTLEHGREGIAQQVSVQISYQKFHF